MRVTLLGSGDAVGVPAPLCDCEYCLESDRRRRPALLVESGDRTLVLDLGPDICAQLHEAGVYDVDGFFATHAHFDHYGGINELHQAARTDHLRNEREFSHPTFGKTVTVYGSRPVWTFTEEAFPHVLNNVDYEPLEPADEARFGDLSVRAFELEHAAREFPTQGYAVSADGATVVYAPDVEDVPAVPDYCRDADLLFFDGSVLGAEYHGDAAELRVCAERFGADRVVLTNVSEHMLERHTADVADRTDYEVWSDFEAATL